MTFIVKTVHRIIPEIVQEAVGKSLVGRGKAWASAKRRRFAFNPKAKAAYEEAKRFNRENGIGPDSEYRLGRKATPRVLYTNAARGRRTKPTMPELKFMEGEDG